MHAADIAYVLEALPPDDRLAVWAEVAPEQAGDVFVEIVRRRCGASSSPSPTTTRLVALLDGSMPKISAIVFVVAARGSAGAACRCALESSERSIFEETIQYDDALPSATT